MKFTLKKLSEEIGIEFSGNGDIELSHICGLESIVKGGLAYITDPSELANLPTPAGIFDDRKTNLDDLDISQDSAVIVPLGTEDSRHNLLFSPDPMYHHCLAGELLYPGCQNSGKISSEATVGSNVTIGKNVTIDGQVFIYDNVTIGDNTVIRAGTVIMENVKIGQNCLIYPNVSIRENSEIGDRVILHPGVVIGADGFGFFQRNGKNLKIPQVGSVLIEDDVEIGANTTIDRARFSKTVIGRGSKMDNLIHIAHNVKLGEDSLIAAQSGIAGSTSVGHHLMMGGQSGIRDNLKIGDGVTLLARTVITSKTNDNAVVAGMPSRPLEKWRKTQALINGLENLFERVRNLESVLKDKLKK